MTLAQIITCFILWSLTVLYVGGLHIEARSIYLCRPYSALACGIILLGAFVFIFFAVPERLKS